MPWRRIIPSALPADVAERLSDQTHCYAQRPTRAELLQANRKMREEIDRLEGALRKICHGESLGISAQALANIARAALESTK